MQHARTPCPSPKFTQTHVHRVGDAIQPSHPVSSPSPPAPNPSQHQSLFQWVNSAWGGQRTGVSALASFFPRKSQGWSPIKNIKAEYFQSIFFFLTSQAIWRRKWQSTPIFLPGKFHGWRSLVGYSPWGCKESDTAEWLYFTSYYFPQRLHQFTFPPTVCEGSLFSASLPVIVVFCLFGSIPSNG